MIVVAGEVLIDLVADQHDPTRVHAHPGGSPANTALSLARLGRPVQLVARLSQDAFGQRLRRHLEADGVDLSRCAHALEPTTLAVVTLDGQGQAEYSFYVHGSADGAWTSADLPRLTDEVDAVHVPGSVAMAVEPGATVLLGLLRRAAAMPCTVVLDPNVRPDLWPGRQAAATAVQSWVETASIVKVSEDDLGWLYPGAPLEQVMADWQRRGPDLVIVTRGGDGVLARWGEHVLHRAGVQVEVVDTVGAGDAFSGGLLDGLSERGRLRRDRLPDLRVDELEAVLDHAQEVAALTCTRAGAEPPYRRELRAEGHVALTAPGRA